jgi:protein phosphatase
VFAGFQNDGSAVTERLSVVERPDEAVQLRIEVGAATDAAGRAENEDAVFVGELPMVGPEPGGEADAGASGPGYLLAVADGMGGYQQGEVASGLAVETVQRLFEDDPGADTALLLKQAYRRAKEAIYQSGRARGEAHMMGTTLVAAAIRGKYLTIANIGDSRAYLLRADRLTQITKDHSLVAEQVSQGAITAEEARESPHRNIVTQALGHRPKLDTKMPSIFELTLLPEDRLLLCTDGFHDVIEDESFARVLTDFDAPDAARELVDLAVLRGTTDNVSAVVVSVMPTRIPERELVAARTGVERPSFLVPALAIVGVIVFIALVLLALTFL